MKNGWYFVTTLVRAIAKCRGRCEFGRASFLICSWVFFLGLAGVKPRLNHEP
jgi:hypothetical protein